MALISKKGKTGEPGPPGDYGLPGEEGKHLHFCYHIKQVDFFTDHSNKHVLLGRCKINCNLKG